MDPIMAPSVNGRPPVPHTGDGGSIPPGATRMCASCDLMVHKVLSSALDGEATRPHLSPVAFGLLA